ncbi:prolyl oligopeptidase family serine peptidase [Brachybacterium sp. AOP43-C2-M15]|uniref:prolyl oligopeptidase family serine peptidase n=1 Tax=Brachybacterium sp. AOP43-C2-M15 TaxID=3457661 RepID=UPI0040344B48
MTQHTVDTTGTTPRAPEQPPELSPRPAPRPTERILFGDAVRTPYSWLRDHRDPAVAEHFAAENARTDEHTAHLGALHASLSRDLERPEPQIELSAPVLLGGWWYIDRADPADGATLSRVRDRDGLRGPSGVPDVVPGTLLEGEEILVADCLAMVGFAVSPDHRLIARAEAAIGGCRLIVTDIATGDVVDGSVDGAGPDLVFSADSACLLHTRLDDLGRRHEVRCHRLGSSPASDALLLEEPDHWADLQLTRSRDGSSLLIRSVSPTGSEVWITDLDEACAPARSLTGRIPDAHPVVEHAGDRLLVIHEEPGSRLSVLGQVGLEAMDGLDSVSTLLTAREGEHFESVEAFAGFVALQLRSDGLPQVRLLPRRADGSLDTLTMRTVGQGGELTSIRLEPTPDWHQRAVRYRLDSFLTPPTVLEHDVETGEDTVLLRAEVPGHDPERYVERRLWARSSDGVRVPISVFARRDVPLDGTAPGLLYGDGAFGTSTDPLLRREALAVADHGVVVAIAHVRGGGELGPDWHRQGRRLRKTASFEDFVACAGHLVATGWAAADRLGAVGTGPGGLLVGAAANLAPERFRAVLAGLPLVDPLETLLDPDVMLTLEEWAEWGDPAADEATYRSLASYSPAENVREAEYPAVFAWTSLDGTEVPPACAAIWVAQLRDHVTSDPAERPILLRATPTLGAAGDPRVEGVAWLLDQLGAATLEE